MKQLKFLKRKFLIILGLMAVFLHSCQNDDFYDQDKTSSKSIKVQRLNFSDLQKHPKVLEKIEILTNRKSNYQARMVEMPQYEFTVDTDEIIFIEADTLLSYTFRVFREDDNGLLENLVLKPSENGSNYDAFLFQYDFSEEDIELYQNGQPIPNQQEKTQITYLPNFDEAPLYNARAGENGDPPFEAPSGCAWELIDYDFASDGYYWEAIHYWQLNCNGGGSGSSNGNGSSSGNDGGWTGNGNTGTSPGDGNSNGNQNGGGSGNGGAGSVSPIVTTPVGAIPKGASETQKCASLNALTQTDSLSANIKPIVDQLRTKTNLDKEWSACFDRSVAYSGDYETYIDDVGLKEGPSRTRSRITHGGASIGQIHTHPVETYAIFSWLDLKALRDIYRDATTNNKPHIFLMIVCHNGEVYSLKVDNFEMLNVKINNDLATAKGSNDDEKWTNIEEGLAKFYWKNRNNLEGAFLKKYGSYGISLYKASDNDLSNWDKVELSNPESNNLNVNQTSCN